MKKEAVGLVKELVRISSSIDKSGHGKLSGDLIAIAKSVKDETANEDTIQKFNGAVESLTLAGLETEAEALLKEAGFWSGVGGVAKGIGQGVQKGVQKAVDTAKGVGQGIKDQYQMSNLTGTFDKVNQELATAVDYATKAYGSMQDVEKKQQVGNILAMLQNMQTMGTQVYKLVMDEAAAPEAPAPEAAAPEAESLGAPATPAGGAPAPEAAAETSTLAPGQTVTWESNGIPQTGIVQGPDETDPSKTVVKIGNYPPQSLDTGNLRAACERYRLKRQG